MDTVTGADLAIAIAHLREIPSLNPIGAVIDIVGPDKATHRSYWMTVNGGPAMYSFRIAAQGRYEDELVKREGQWLIYRRKIL